MSVETSKRQRTESSNPDVRINKRRVDAASVIPVVTSDRSRAAGHLYGVDQHGFGLSFRGPGNGSRGGGRMYHGGFRGQHDVHQGFSRGGFRGNVGGHGGNRRGPRGGGHHGGGSRGISRGRTNNGWGSRDNSWNSGYNRREYDRHVGQNYLYDDSGYAQDGGATACYGSRGNGDRHFRDFSSENVREASSVLANKKDTIEASTGLTADVEKPAESSPIIEVDITKSPVVARDILVQELTDEISEKNYVIDGLNAQVLKTKLNKPRQGLVKMNDDIIKKNTILKDKVKSHNETIENLKIKIKEQKNIIMVKNVEISNNKMIVPKYNKLLRKFGSSVQQKVDGSTKEEILSNLDVDVTSNYHYFVAKGFSEIEIMNYMAVLFLDMSCGMRFNFVSRLLKFSSLGFRRCILKALVKSVESEKKEFAITVVQSDVLEEGVGPEDVDAGLITPGRAGPSKVHGLENAPKKTAAPSSYDSCYDSFDQSKFMDVNNYGCGFIRDRFVNYIALWNIREKFSVHKIPDILCPLQSCGEMLLHGVTEISCIVICAPENHHHYGKSLWVCRGHALESINHVDLSAYDMAAVEAEADEAKFVTEKYVAQFKNKKVVTKKLFVEKEVDANMSDGGVLEDENENVLDVSTEPMGNDSNASSVGDDRNDEEEEEEVSGVDTTDEPKTDNETDQRQM